MELIQTGLGFISGLAVSYITYRFLTTLGARKSYEMLSKLSREDKCKALLEAYGMITAKYELRDWMNNL
ncbi:MAG: hypothetical protein WCE94_04535 [Candidatus Methanoperedens sp.]